VGIAGAVPAQFDEIGFVPRVPPASPQAEAVQRQAGGQRRRTPRERLNQNLFRRCFRFHQGVAAKLARHMPQTATGKLWIPLRAHTGAIFGDAVTGLSIGQQTTNPTGAPFDPKQRLDNLEISLRDLFRVQPDQWNL